MKKLVSILVAMFTLLSSSVYAENAIYIYRNDGNFNAFLDNRVDSISYSCVDTSGVEHGSYVTQLVHTSDSVYRIPLSAIDSIAFTDRPAPEIKSDVFYLTSSHLPYITSIEDLTITFSGTIPDELLPQEGNVLVSDVYEGLLIDGFAGRVKTVADTGASMVIECEQVSITDIYERLIITGSSSSVAETVQSQSISPKVVDSGSKSFKLNEFSHSFENVTISDKPVARIDYTVFIEPNQSPIVSMYLYHTHNLSATIEHSQDGDHTPDPLWLVKAPIPLPYKLYVRMDLGLFWQAVGSMEMSLEVPYTIGFVNGFSYNENGLTQVNRIIKSEQGTPTANVDINGSITAGLAGSFTFGFVTDKVLSVNGEVRGGVQVAGSYKLSDYDVTTLGQDGTVYEMLKDTKIELNRYVSVNMGFGIVGFTGNVECKGLNLPYEKIETLDEWYLLPTFTTPEVKVDEENPTAVITIKASRDLLMPVKIGVGVKNQTTQESVGIQKSDVDYRIQTEYPLQNIGGIYTNLTEGQYVAYPVVEVLGKNIHATPETMFDIVKEEEHIPANEVDLGLSVKWADWNVGASSPEEYGNYYAWGETGIKFKYAYDTYKYYNSIEGDYINLGSNISGTEYDVAKKKWGWNSGWRMPTEEDFQELIDKCEWENTTYNGVAGCKVTGPNGNSIFLPFAGGFIYTTIVSTGVIGGYWSGSFSGDHGNACSLAINSSSGNPILGWGGNRTWGCSVRPVRD